jgi:hypothetical protein
MRNIHIKTFNIIGSRETAFIYAINSAALMYEITRACSRGDLSKCICNKNLNNDIDVNKATAAKGLNKFYEWNGCSENVLFGYKLSKKFVDSDELIDAEIKNKKLLLKNKQNQLMNLHNNEVGRRIILKKMKQICKCHGVSGSCSIKVCWKIMPEFRVIGDELMNKYALAARIDTKKPRERIKKLREIVLSRYSRNLNTKPNLKDDLVFISKSPNFCRKNLVHGVIGTNKRLCSSMNSTQLNLSDQARESCEYLCCGRGFHTQIVEVEEECECQFQWCCSVKCKKCKKKMIQYFCN